MKTIKIFSVVALVFVAVSASGCSHDAVSKTAADAGYTVVKTGEPRYGSEGVSSLRCGDDTKAAYPASGPDKYGHFVPFTVCCPTPGSCYIVERS
jgi:hypothetical protein